MGCGKSKHAVETATTVVKSSTHADGTKQTTATTKTAKETSESSLMQKQVQTKCLSIEDEKKEATIPKVDPCDVVKTEDVALTLGESIEKSADDVKVKESDPTDNVVPALIENAGKAVEVVEDDEKVKDLGSSDATVVNTDNVIPTSSNDDVGITKVVKEDEGNKESTLKADTTTKIDNLPPVEELKTKEFNQTYDNKTKTEFMTPTSEDVVGAFEVGKGSTEVKDSNEESIVTAISDEKPMITIDSSSNPKDNNLKVEEKKPVSLAVESTKVEAKKEEDLKVKVDMTKAKITPATETEKVSTASKANVEEAQEKEP
ncbi:hypothetical protein E3N88_25107 [Mikania micrantha]|uniref:Uncharacterized protein n=1 Tax=Mikania micrantha TaxID=192012 RepID=A0A5N6N3T8_9ASTR|nr:hypothetical protein E3N88_25107 [Mikania micrantha]